MNSDLLTTRDELVEFRRIINRIRAEIEYDRSCSDSKSELFDELESRLNDVVEHLDDMDSKLKEHVYAYDVTVTATRRVYVKGCDECEAEEAAIEYAEQCIDLDGEWSMQDTVVFRDEDEETTSVYDVEV